MQVPGNSQQHTGGGARLAEPAAEFKSSLPAAADRAKRD
jgi:hypothetical protein